MKLPYQKARLHLAGLWLGLIGSAMPAAALTLEETLRLAEQQAPALTAQAANVEAARHAAVPAGELPDPQLRLGVQNLPIEGESRWQLGEEAMTMQMVGVMQDVPNRAKRRARVEAAQAAVAVADSQQQLTRLQVRQNAAQAWITTRAVEQKLELFAQLYKENELLAKAIDRKVDRDDGFYTWANSASNKAAADRILKGWANILLDALNEAKN